ncbi:MAG: YqgE/AlgH family protein [Cyclobacteriaceae bacterium]
MNLFDFKTSLRPAPGLLLVSEPMLPDPNFERSIILLCAHDTEGSFGFVLNKPSGKNVSELVDGFAGLHAQVFTGGPVELNTLHFIHCFPEIEGGLEIRDGIYWGGDIDSLRELAAIGKCTPEHVRFFLGYSGLSGGHLDDELKENTWIVSGNVDRSLIFETVTDEMWKKAMIILGGRFSIYANYPTDPRLN